MTTEAIQNRKDLVKGWLSRTLLNAEKAQKTTLPHYEIVALVFKAWNYFRQNRKVRVVRWSHGQGEEFPRAM